MKKRLTMFLAALFLTMGTALAQTKVSGTVLSQEDGQPIIGAAVKGLCLQVRRRSPSPIWVMSRRP